MATDFPDVELSAPVGGRGGFVKINGVRVPKLRSFSMHAGREEATEVTVTFLANVNVVAATDPGPTPEETT
jgi:hypothetical protein